MGRNLAIQIGHEPVNGNALVLANFFDNSKVLNPDGFPSPSAYGLRAMRSPLRISSRFSAMSGLSRSLQPNSQ
jgi:hypothetical protein